MLTIKSHFLEVLSLLIDKFYFEIILKPPPPGWKEQSILELGWRHTAGSNACLGSDQCEHHDFHNKPVHVA